MKFQADLLSMRVCAETERLDVVTTTVVQVKDAIMGGR